MKARYVSWIGGILVFLCLVVGCQTSTSVKLEESNSTPVADQETENAETDQRAQDTSSLELGDAEQRLRQLEADQLLEQKQQETFIRHLIATAKNKISQHEYNVAKNFLDQALQLDPGHEEALQLRSLVGNFLGELDSQTTTLHDMYVNEVKVKIEQAKLEARNHYRQGNEYVAKKEYDLAITEYNSALEIIKWAPYELGMDKLREQIEIKIKETETLSEAYRAEERLAKVEEARRQAEIFEAEEQAQRASKIRILIERATEFYTRQKYDKAEALIQQVLSEDSSNKLAKKLLEDIRDSSHSFIAEKTLQKKIDEWKLFLEDMRRSSIPITDLIVYPDKEYWHNVVNKRKDQSDLHRTVAGEGDTPVIQKIKTQLQTVNISLNFSDTPFQDVIRYIHTISGINIVVDPKIIQTFEIEGTRVNLQVNSLKLDDALQILLQFHDLVYLFKDDVLFITSKTSELARGKSIPVLHDIRDLTGQIKDFPGPKIRLMTEIDQDSGGATFDEEETESKTGFTGEKLTELIKSTIEPESWDNEDYSIAETSGQLLVVHTEDVQNEIKKFLNDMRRFSGMMVALESRFIQVTDDFLEHVGIDWRGIGENALQVYDKTKQEFVDVIEGRDDTHLGSVDDRNGALGKADNDGRHHLNPSSGLFFGKDKKGHQEMRMRTEHVDNYDVNTRLKKTGGLAFQVASLDDTQLNAIVWMIKKTGRSEVLMAPRLTAFNTQRASLTVVEQTSYVKDFDVEVAQSAYIADPQMGTLQTGVVLDVRPTISNDRKYITLELRPTIAQLSDLVDTPTSLGNNNQEVTIQTPKIMLQCVETTVRIPDQGTLLLGGLKSYVNYDKKLDVPVLGDIPIIGFFFSQRTKAEEQRDLIILIKAKIIDLEEEEERAVGLRK